MLTGQRFMQHTKHDARRAAASWLKPVLAVPVLPYYYARIWKQRRLDAARISFGLTFPRGVDQGDAQGLVQSLSGIQSVRRSPWPTLVFELIKDHRGISHYLWVPPTYEQYVFAQLYSAIPGLRADPVKVPAWRWNLAAEVGLTGSRFPLRLTDPAATARRILATPGTLYRNEAVTLQWIVVPTQATDTEDREAAKKQAGAIFAVIGRVGACSAYPERSGALLHQMLTALRSDEARPRTYFVTRDRPKGLMLQRLQRRAAPLGGIEFPGLLSDLELAGLAGVPIGTPQAPGLALGAARHLPPSSDIPPLGLQVGEATFPGRLRPLAIRPADLDRHMLVIGSTGTGKSCLGHGMFCQAAELGGDQQVGAAFLDPNGDSADEILDSLPRHCIEEGRVVVI